MKLGRMTILRCFSCEKVLHFEFFAAKFKCS
ncbi:unnamed protein product [Chondrus crispus]|uniref:Uncharacterized protein n=1 Tax=Chondrus crispus TaxID=2769 RepID=R7QLD6_CHOCR|nr:unnamed protein product [Chondrus crispus]CDF38210.1 unnamed protein product [Chondrus crispus]|eukprot:XP_005718095.1 unnamed protein product [Chondrus crispus]